MHGAPSSGHPYLGGVSFVPEHTPLYCSWVPGIQRCISCMFDIRTLSERTAMEWTWPSFDLEDAPPYINQLLSPESLRKTGYFDPQAVLHWRQAYRTMRRNRIPRILVEMGLGGILATQLWHQIYIDASLADVPDPRSRLRLDTAVHANGAAAGPGARCQESGAGRH